LAARANFDVRRGPIFQHGPRHQNLPVARRGGRREGPTLPTPGYPGRTAGAGVTGGGPAPGPFASGKSTPLVGTWERPGPPLGGGRIQTGPSDLRAIPRGARARGRTYSKLRSTCSRTSAIPAKGAKTGGRRRLPGDSAGPNPPRPGGAWRGRGRAKGNPSGRGTGGASGGRGQAFATRGTGRPAVGGGGQFGKKDGRGGRVVRRGKGRF